MNTTRTSNCDRLAISEFEVSFYYGDDEHDFTEKMRLRVCIGRQGEFYVIKETTVVLK